LKKKLPSFVFIRISKTITKEN